jgi:type II secretory pathway component PulM
MRGFAHQLQVVRSALARRTRRERVALAAMAGTIAAALWLQLLWSAHHESAHYTRLVGDLQARNAAMRNTLEALQEARIQANTVRSITPEQALKVFADGLRAAGISTIAVLPEGQGQVRLSGSAGFDAWLGWLAKAHAEYGIEVQRAALEPLREQGLVKVDATIALAGAR